MRRTVTVDAVYRALARFVVRFRWPIVAFWILAAILTSAVLPSLASQINDNNSAFLPSNAPSSRAADLAAPILGAGAGGRVANITIIGSRAGRLGAADLAAMQREAALAERVSHVDSAQLTGISADGQALVILARVNFNVNDINKDKPVVDALQRTFVEAHPPAGLQLHLAGQAATVVANQASSNKAGRQVQTFSLLFIVVLLLLVFRSLPAAIITLLPSGLALVIAERLVGGLGASGLKISSITDILMIILLLGAGTDYGLFLVFRVREELRAGSEPREAVQNALVRVGESITGSAGTVILALLTLLIASFGIYHDLGLPLAIGVAVMLMIGLTLLPALLAILGRRAFWPARIQPGTQREGLWGRVAGRLVRHPGATLAVGVLVFLALAAGALSYQAGGFGGATSAPKGSDAAAGNAALARHFPQTSNNPGNLILAYRQPVWDHPQSLAAAQSYLQRSGDFTQLAGPLDPNGTRLTPALFATLHHHLGPPQRLPVLEPAALRLPRALYNAYRSTGSLVSADGRVIQFEVSLRAGSQDSTAAMNATP
ncbi:MAG TPA: MMPL family transporter, partial [Solirubrobacteraceae bacterium]|nr:MMPL family transporter [Solirubrobacteraceae bacterium]